MITSSPQNDFHTTTSNVEIPFVVLLTISFAAPFVVFPALAHFNLLPKQSFLEIGLIFLAFSWAFQGALHPQKRGLSFNPLILPIMLLLAWSLLSLLFVSANRHEGTVAIKPILVGTCYFYLTCQIIKTDRQREALFYIFFTAATVVSLIGIAQYLLGFAGIPQLAPPAATFANKNAAVHFLVLAIPLGLYFLLTVSNRFHIWLCCAQLSIVLTYLIYTKTRAGWLAVVVELLFLAFFVIQNLKRKEQAFIWNKTKSVSVCIALCFVLIFSNFTPKGFGYGLTETVLRASTIADVQGNHVRFDIWQDSLDLIKDNFLTGVGAGNFGVFYPRYQKHAEYMRDRHLEYAHNDSLHLVAELGVIGLVIFLFFISRIHKTITGHLSTPALTARSRWQTHAIILALFGTTVNAQFSFPWQLPIPTFTIFTLLGALHFIHKKPIFTPKTNRAHKAAAILLLFFLPFFLFKKTKEIAANSVLMDALTAEYTKQWDQAIHYAEKSMDLYRGSSTTHSIIGRSLFMQGRYHDALQHFYTVLEDMPYDYNMQVITGRTHYLLGDFPKAMDLYRQVLRFSPHDGVIHNQIGNIYYRQGDFAQAIPYYLKAVELDEQNSANYYINIAKVRIKQKKFQEAILALQKSIHQKPENPIPHQYLATIYTDHIANPVLAMQHRTLFNDLSKRE